MSSSPLIEAATALLWERPGQEAIPALRTCCEAGERLCVVSFAAPADTVARLLSERLGGQFFVGNGSVTWVLGRSVRWLVDAGKLPAVQSARSTLTGVVGSELPWTIGGICRAALKWACPPQRYDRRVRWLQDVGDWAYRHVIPGPLPDAELWDLDAAYYQLLCRLPSPHVTCTRERLIWHPLRPEERSRWLELLLALRGQKLCRNALLGAMIGAGNGARRYIRGALVPLKRCHGPLQAAGHLVVRSCYEAAGLETHAARTHYCNTDCVIRPKGSPPRVWPALGLPYSLRATGAAEVRCLGVYRVGDAVRGRFDLPGVIRSSVVTSPLPERLWVREWLA